MADFEREYRVPHGRSSSSATTARFGNILDAANELICAQHAAPGQEPAHRGRARRAGARATRRPATSPRRSGSSRKRSSCTATARRASEIALLYRSNAQSRVIESALFNAGMPYRVYGGLRFFERAEVKHALAYLRLIENPNDDTSFLRVVNFPARGIGARTHRAAAGRGARRAAAACCRASARSPARAAPTCAAFVAQIDAMREQTQGLTLREIIEHVLRGLGPGRLLQDRPRRPGPPREPGGAGQRGREPSSRRKASARTRWRCRSTSCASRRPARASTPARRRHASRAAASPDAETGEIMSPLAAFLTHAALEAGDNQAQAGQDAIQLMTVHSAKGLEFDCVFITGLEEGLFPHENSIDRPRRPRGGAAPDVRGDHARAQAPVPELQRRRACCTARRATTSRAASSTSCPRRALKWITPRNQGFGSGFAREYQQAWARGSGLHSIVGTGRVEPRYSAAPIVAEGAVARPARRARACSTPSSAKAWSSRSKAAATMRARRSTSAATA